MVEKQAIMYNDLCLVTYISFDFRIESDSIYYEAKKEALVRVVAQRNELVHHLLPNFDLCSEKSCDELTKKLDEQSKKIRNEIANMKVIAKAFDDGMKQLASHLGTVEGKKQFELLYLRQSRLVILLGDIAAQMARVDGWTLMSIAGQIAKDNAPEELALLQEKYGHKSLKRLILATEIFDIYEELTPRGGTRSLYRLKSGWESSLT